MSYSSTKESIGAPPELSGSSHPTRTSWSPVCVAVTDRTAMGAVTAGWSGARPVAARASPAPADVYELTRTCHELPSEIASVRSAW